MADPLTVARYVCRVINCSDPEGVMVIEESPANSSGQEAQTSQESEDITRAASEWSDSEKILRLNHITKKPVKYGQCWVFAGLMTTVFRALGIPCRPVTNYNSGFDIDGSYTIDKYIYANDDGIDDTEEQDEKANVNSETVWSFHCWNEVWLRRRDLMDIFDSYDGWQAVDATPTVPSRGLYMLGPCSVYAVKEGSVDRLHNTGYFFSAVNGDMITWIVHDDGYNIREEKYSHDPHSIGKAIITKAIGEDTVKDPQILTSNYKHEEGTQKERNVTEKVTKRGHRGKKVFDASSTTADVIFDSSITDNGPAGDIVLKITAKNTSDYPRTIKSGHVTALHATYQGHIRGVIRKDMLSPQTIPPGKEVSYTFTWEVEQYWDVIEEGHRLQLDIAAFLPADKDRVAQYYSKIHTYQVTKPKPNVEAPKTVKVNDFAQLEFKFTNPLKKPLTNCELRFESAGRLTDEIVKLNRVTGNVSQQVKLMALKPGSANVVIKLINSEKVDISTVAKIKIE